MKVPTAVHIDGMVYYNMEVAKAAGVDPTAWTSLDAMFADFDKVQGRRLRPARHRRPAVAGRLPDPRAGRGHRRARSSTARSTARTPDPAALDSPEMRSDARMAAQVPGGDRRRLGQPRVERHHQHGDHRQGADADPRRLDEGRMARRRQGRRAPTSAASRSPARKSLVVTVDAWGLLGGQDEAKQDGRARLRRGGARPGGTGRVRQGQGLDPDPARRAGRQPRRLLARACSRCSTDPTHQVPNPHSTVDADWQSSIWDVVFNFWSDPVDDRRRRHRPDEGQLRGHPRLTALPVARDRTRAAAIPHWSGPSNGQATARRRRGDADLLRDRRRGEIRAAGSPT